MSKTSRASARNCFNRCWDRSRKARCRSSSAAITAWRPDRSRPRRPRSAGADKKLGLIWVDAHGDMNTPETSGSGNVHGMPLAALLGPEPVRAGAHRRRPFPPSSPSTRCSSASAISTTREKELVRASKVHVFTMKDVDRLGMAQVMERALTLAGRGTGGIHVSFDLDVCDPAIAPGVGTAVKGGLDYREAHVVMEMVAESGMLTSLDLVEVNPTLDMRNTTAELGTELALSAMGKSIL